MALELVTPPATPVVDLADLKRHVVAEDFTDDDAYLTSLELAAVSFLDGHTGLLGRCLNNQTWRLSYDCFPSGALKIPLGPVTAVDSVQYTDTDGVVQTWDSANYVVDTEGPEGWVVPVDEWPDTQDTVNAVQVTFQAGGDIPEAVKQAIRMLVADWYEFRHTPMKNATSIPYGVRSILAPFTRWTL